MRAPFPGDHLTLRRYSTLGSTNDEARRLADAGAPPGTIIHAQRQSAGRGRKGRLWISEPGNLFASIILRPNTTMARVGEISLLAGVALAESVETLLADSPALRDVCCKWPNDILIDGAKLGGILIETATHDNRLAWVVVGIGVNLASCPPHMGDRATCLRDHGADISPEAALACIFPRLWRWYEDWGQPQHPEDGFPAVRSAWEKRAYIPQSPLVVDTGIKRICGQYAGLDEDGALLINDSKGMQHKIVTGDVLSMTED